MKTKDIYYSQKPMQVYDSFLSKFLNKFVKNYSREEAVSEIGLSGKACLDIACGDGELLNKYLYKRYVACEGVDISKNLINKAKSENIKNCTYYVEDIERFVDNAIKSGKKYDTVYLLAILEHIQWPSIFIKKIYRLLRKNGHIVIEVPNVAWLPHRISLAHGSFPITAPTVGVIPGVYDEHIRFFTVDTLDEVVCATGLANVRIDCSGKFRFIKRFYLKLLSPDIIAVYRK